MGKNYIGTTLHGFVVLEQKRENRRTYLYIVCPLCGQKKWMRHDTVQRSTSCGCFNETNNLYKSENLIGKNFDHRLTPLKPTEEKDPHNGSIIWECECDCGNTVYVAANQLKKGAVRSCGCLRKEYAKRHGVEIGAATRSVCIDHTNVRNLVSKPHKNSKSGVKGVVWDNSRLKWKAQIGFKKHNYYLGRYLKLADAIAVRKEAEKRIHGSFLEWHKELFPKQWEQFLKQHE